MANHVSQTPPQPHGSFPHCAGLFTATLFVIYFSPVSPVPTANNTAKPDHLRHLSPLTPLLSSSKRTTLLHKARVSAYPLGPFLGLFCKSEFDVPDSYIAGIVISPVLTFRSPLDRFQQSSRCDFHGPSMIDFGLGSCEDHFHMSQYNPSQTWRAYLHVVVAQL